MSTIVGNNDANLLTGGQGPDLLRGLGGDDTLIGGGGGDTLDGGAGFDTADYSGSPFAISGGFDTISGDNGSDTLISIERIVGSIYDDTLSAGSHSGVLIDGGAGNDLLQGPAPPGYQGALTSGADTLLGGDGADTISASGGQADPNSSNRTDLIDGGAGDDIITTYGNATVLGGSGNDTINFASYSYNYGAFYSTGNYNTTTGPVTIDAGPGDDHVIITSQGQALVTLGQGSDTLSLTYATGVQNSYNFSTTVYPTPLQSTVTDFQPGQGGDQIDLSGFLQSYSGFSAGQNPFAGGYAELRQVGADTILEVDRDGGGDNYTTLLVLKNTSVFSYTAANFEGFAPAVGGQIAGTPGADTLIGSDEADSISAGAGNDVIYAHGGLDTLIGGPGADTIYGGSGNDLFQGTAAEMAGDSIHGLHPGDMIAVTDAPFSSFSYTLIGTQLTLHSGSGSALELADAPVGRLVLGANADGSAVLTPAAPDLNLSDFNGDGHSDLLWRNAGGTFTTWQISGNATANQEAPNAYVNQSAGGDWQIQGKLDFNGDGLSDLFMRNAAGVFRIWTSTGAGFTQNAYVDSSVDPSWSVAALGDFNGDGKADIIWRNTAGTFTEWQSTGSAFQQNTYVDLSVGTDWHLVGAGDFNGDGKTDLIWRNNNGLFSEWQATASGFTPNVYIDGSVNTSWHMQGFGDFNGDGKTDILWRNDNGTFSIWSSTGAGFAQNTYVNSTVDPSWHIAAIGDFNNDGKDDIVWRNDSGQFTIWQSTGSGFVANVLVDGSVGTDWTLVANHYDVV